ncbi:hypothetical protein V9N52_001630, partial [Vibrio navarrensis]
HSEIKYIRETEYKKFVELKINKHLTLTDYTNIWKVIIMLLISEMITSKELKYPLFQRFSKLNALKKSVDEFYLNAFSPEIISAINFAEESALSASILNKNFKAEGEEKEKIEFSESRFQINLLYIQKHFEEALSSISLTKNYTVYIDGIDIRPSDLEYHDYLDCVKGLANAIWSLNSDFFGNIKGSKGRIKAVLLIRPDIFDSIGFQNQNSKVKDNSIVLDWRTQYPEHRRSELFYLADKLLSSQQEKTDLTEGQAWDYYFPFNTKNVTYKTDDYTSFISLLRYSLYRPRGVLVILSILKENFLEKGRHGGGKFKEEDLLDAMFTRKFSDYFLGEIKDHLSFYYPSSDYEHLIKFFQYLNGNSRFAYDEYLSYFKQYMEYFESNKIKAPGYCESADIFLQFLYEINVIGYIVDTDEGAHFGWCHRERSTSNIAPKVKTGVRYDTHYAIMKALDLGKKSYKNKLSKNMNPR